MGEWPLLPQSRAQSVLQDKPLNDDLAKLGLKREEDLFTNANGKPDRMVFLLYYSRTLPNRNETEGGRAKRTRLKLSTHCGQMKRVQRDANAQRGMLKSEMKRSLSKTSVPPKEK
jgi:hypothetical protein